MPRRARIKRAVLATESTLRSRWRRCSIPVSRLVLLHPVTEEAKGEIGDGEAAEDQDAREDHGLVADGLHERVEDLGEGARGDVRAGDFERVALHALLPFPARGVEIGGARRRIAVVLFVSSPARGDVADDVRHCFVRFLVHVAHDARPEAVDAVRADGEQEEVEEELGVLGEDVGESRMLCDERE